jgi:hypothetical protein
VSTISVLGTDDLSRSPQLIVLGLPFHGSAQHASILCSHMSKRLVELP